MTEKQKTTVPPWKSQKIWAALIGVGAAAVAFAFGQTELGVGVLTAAAAFILGRGLERFGAGLVLVAALTLGACESGAQVPSTCLSTAIQAAMDVIANCLPRGTDTSDPAAVRAALEACPVERDAPYIDEGP